MATSLVADGVHAVPLGAVNAFPLDGPDGLTLIDAGFPGRVGLVLDAIRGLGRAPGDLKHVVLTHAHPDHIGSLAAIVKETGARTYMHALDAPIAERGSGFRPMSPAPGLMAGVLFRLFAGKIGTVEPAGIDVKIQDGDVLPIAGGLRVIHVPGHCAGQVALLRAGDGVLFAADACSNVMGLGPPIGYEDRTEGELSQEKLAGLAFEVACFGHGKAIARGAAQRFRARWPRP